MDSRIVWSRSLVIVGSIALLLGGWHTVRFPTIDPLDLGFRLNLSGGGIVALGAYLGKGQRGIIRYGMLRIFILLVAVVAALFELSAVRAIEPLDLGLLLILPGSGMVVLGVVLGKGQRGIICYWIWVFVLIAVGVGALFAASAVGGIGGHTLRSPWWLLLLLPYIAGWMLGFIGILVMFCRFLYLTGKGYIRIPSIKSFARFVLGCAVAGIIGGTGWRMLPHRPKIPAETRVPPDMVLIPAGSFRIGDTLGDASPPERETPTHTVTVSAFYLDRYEVTKAAWDEVYPWAVAHGYTFAGTGSGKATNHPVWGVNWYDAVKWCNARSEKEGRIPAYYTSAAQTTIYRSDQGTPAPFTTDVQNDWVKWNQGYRLPTEAEWEYAARGGLIGKRFPWGDTISHTQANYYSTNIYSYDASSTRGFHPSYRTDGEPYTSPVGSFVPNGYGLYDMAGNVAEWCWDRDGSYSSASETDPRGPSSDPIRVARGGSWLTSANICRSARRNGYATMNGSNSGGFRSVLPRDQ